MSLNIGRALQEGIVRTISRNGLLLVVVWAVLGALNLLAYNSAIIGVIPDAPNQQTVMIGPVLSLSPLVAGVVAFGLYLVSLVFAAAALRIFVSDETRAIPGEYLTHNLGWLLVNLVVGYVVFFVAIWIGFLLLVVPGIFLLVSLYFWFVFVAVEDQNFVEAFRNSWAMAKGNRWRLLGLGVVVMVVLSVLYGVVFVLAVALPPWIALAVYAVIVAAFGVFSLATTARAYVQLTPDGTADATAAV